MKYMVAGEEFIGVYFLVDGIYPDFPYLVKTVAEQNNATRKVVCQSTGGV